MCVRVYILPGAAASLAAGSAQHVPAAARLAHVEPRARAQVDLEPHEPYSPPSNMYLWWGPSTNHRFVGSGEHIRHLLHMGQVCARVRVHLCAVMHAKPKP